MSHRQRRLENLIKKNKSSPGQIPPKESTQHSPKVETQPVSPTVSHQNKTSLPQSPIESDFEEGCDPFGSEASYDPFDPIGNSYLPDEDDLSDLSSCYRDDWVSPQARAAAKLQWRALTPTLEFNKQLQGRIRVYEPPVLEGTNRDIDLRGMYLYPRRQTKWSGSSSGGQAKWRIIPWVNKGGCVTSTPLAYWKCTQFQWFSTVLRAVIQRLRSRRSANKRRTYKTYDHLTMIASMYLISGDFGMVNRMMSCHRRSFGRLAYHYRQKLDLNEDFFLDQTVKVSWSKPRLCSRDMSNSKLFKKYYEKKQVTRHSFLVKANMICKQLADRWIVRLGTELRTKQQRSSYMGARCSFEVSNREGASLIE